LHQPLFFIPFGTVTAVGVSAAGYLGILKNEGGHTIYFSGVGCALGIVAGL